MLHPCQPHPRQLSDLSYHLQAQPRAPYPAINVQTCWNGMEPRMVHAVKLLPERRVPQRRGHDADPENRQKTPPKFFFPLSLVRAFPSRIYSSLGLQPSAGLEPR